MFVPKHARLIHQLNHTIMCRSTHHIPPHDLIIVVSTVCRWLGSWFVRSVRSVAANVCVPPSSPVDIIRWKLTIVSALAKDILSLVSMLRQGKVIWEVVAGQVLMLGFHREISVRVYTFMLCDEYAGLVAFIYCFDTLFLFGLGMNMSEGAWHVVCK